MKNWILSWKTEGPLAAIGVQPDHSIALLTMPDFQARADHPAARYSQPASPQMGLQLLLLQEGAVEVVVAARRRDSLLQLPVELVGPLRPLPHPRVPRTREEEAAEAVAEVWCRHRLCR